MMQNVALVSSRRGRRVGSLELKRISQKCRGMRGLLSSCNLIVASILLSMTQTQTSFPREKSLARISGFASNRLLLPTWKNSAIVLAAFGLEEKGTIIMVFA